MLRSYGARGHNAEFADGRPSCGGQFIERRQRRTKLKITLEIENMPAPAGECDEGLEECSLEAAAIARRGYGAARAVFCDRDRMTEANGTGVKLDCRR